jgi:hypothetical protein
MKPWNVHDWSGGRPPRTETCRLRDSEGKSLCSAEFTTTSKGRIYCDKHMNQVARESAWRTANKLIKAKEKQQRIGA